MTGQQPPTKSAKLKDPALFQKFCIFCGLFYLLSRWRDSNEEILSYGKN